METVVNIPIQMISVCSTIGELTPMRFRFENDEHVLETVNVESVLARKDAALNGVKEILFTCRADVGGSARLFILKYSITSHKWIMFKLLS